MGVVKNGESSTEAPDTHTRQHTHKFFDYAWGYKSHSRKEGEVKSLPFYRFGERALRQHEATPNPFQSNVTSFFSTTDYQSYVPKGKGDKPYL